ncbi:MAG TPA: SPOR domain-containing protein [Ideonella sp.]|uniref:SPOR domain-containing protein n=1 Tax=Ideonella sp. TaxID=1929293 RepID=UPI002B8F1D1E|nr:SPOR domain-containing protein [Ideonella sp.]HSI50453.1 SPOR domain-containing protein [Ideonella sp.]
MGLLSKFKFGSSKTAAKASPSAAVDPSELVREVRSRARRRLVGAAMLLVIGIIGFPLLFETQPRPIPVDIPIEIPARDTVPPLLPSGARQARPDPALQPPPEEAPAANAADVTPQAVDPSPPASMAAPMPKPAPLPMITEAAPSRPQPASKPAQQPSQAVAVTPLKPASKPVEKPAEKPAEQRVAEKPPEPKPVAVKPAEKPATEKPTPEQMLAGKSTMADDGRFVVQIGAFAEAGSAREARGKVEGLGLKTYTQVIESATGRRIRVRVGPYATKAEADKAAARIKASGLPAAVLTL